MKIGYFKAESTTEYALPTSLFLLLPTLVLYTIFFIYPLARLFWISFFQPEFTFGNYISFFEKSFCVVILLKTIRVSLIVALVCLIIGYPVAYAIAHAKGRRLAIYLACIILPFWTSILVRNYAWTILLQRKGIINTLLGWIGFIHEPLSLLYNERAVMIGMIHFLIPFMILAIYSVLRRIDQNLVQAAYNLGANPVQAFLLVVFPLSLPGVGAGFSIVFIIGLGFFITPALLGGTRDLMISTLIETQVSLNNWPFASAIAIILLLVTLILILILNKMLGLDKVYRHEV